MIQLVLSCIGLAICAFLLGHSYTNISFKTSLESAVQSGIVAGFIYAEEFEKCGVENVGCHALVLDKANQFAYARLDK